MRLVKVPSTSLQPGMFVAELDRPWLETPFGLQGFVVRDSAEAIYVSKFVDHVFVDAEFKGRPTFLNLAVEPTAKRTGRGEVTQEDVDIIGIGIVAIDRRSRE